MSDPPVAEAIDNIYASLQADNADLDAHIATLKAALARAGVRDAVFDPAGLAQNNRSGRKLLQAHFRQRGVSILFLECGRGKRSGALSKSPCAGAQPAPWRHWGATARPTWLPSRPADEPHSTG